MHKIRPVCAASVAIVLALFVVVVVGSSCGGQLGAIVPGASNATGGNVTVNLMADFAGSAAAKLKRNAARVACPARATSGDGPQYVAGEDCDGDGGVVAYATPSSFKVAFKWLTLIRQNDGKTFDVIPDTGMLAAAQVVDLTAPVAISLGALPAGYYPEYLAEIYYFELTMPLYDVTQLQTIRVYVSDDDFETEGSLGHHQGDITLVGDDGKELGFVGAGDRWDLAHLSATRGQINGAGGADAETGHLRGLYGDQHLWNGYKFAQGPKQDIFKFFESLDLVVGKNASTVTFSFSVKDSWYFEDFDANGLFNPCIARDGCAEGAEWSPIFNTPDVVIE